MHVAREEGEVPSLGGGLAAELAEGVLGGLDVGFGERGVFSEFETFFDVGVAEGPDAVGHGLPRLGRCLWRRGKDRS